MKAQITTSTTIQATKQDVWKAIINFSNYTDWNPFIRQIKGRAKVGEQLSVQIDTMNFKPTVLQVIPNKLFQWKGKLFFKGLFDGTHSFEISETKNGDTLFIHSEKFSGILVPLFKRKLLTKTKNGFETMNKALKMHVES